ncbi:MAG: hypothetical protein MJ157_03085, partial [Clostridia bacterium]|nr:hypothetical protein [Clostridia bacterium]
MDKEPIEASWVLEKINLMRKESADLVLRQKAAELLLQNAPEVIRQNYDLNMQLAIWLYQEQDWTELLKLVKLIAVLEDASCFCWEKHPRRAEIFAALQKEEEWGVLFSTLKNSLQHNLNGEQLLELINYLNKLLLLSQNQKASLVLSKNGPKIKYDSQTFRDILAEETVQVAALALIKLLNS